MDVRSGSTIDRTARHSVCIALAVLLLLLLLSVFSHSRFFLRLSSSAQTPIPLAYSRHTSRFLVMYTATLPLALVGSLQWGTIPVMMILCWALFGILEIGNLIEEPFTGVADLTNRPLLPLTEICRTIRRDVRQIAQYATHAKSYKVPTIKRTPRTPDMTYPEGFAELRKMLQNATAAELNATQATLKEGANATAASEHSPTNQKNMQRNKDAKPRTSREKQPRENKVV